FSCKSPYFGGHWESEYYLLGDGHALTLERSRWQIDFGVSASESIPQATFRGLESSLIKRLGRGVTKPSGSRPPASNTDFHDISWKKGRRFDTSDGPVWVYLQPTPETDRFTVIVERESPALEAEQTPDWVEGWSTRPGEFVGRPAQMRQELARALDGSNHALAVALLRKKPSWGDGKAFARAIDRAGSGPPASSDLLFLATHVWLLFVMDRLDLEAVEWKGIVRELGSQGVRFEADHYVGWTYCGSLAASLARRAGTNRWTDEGFAEWLEGGASDSCLCDDEAMNKVIASGETFLRGHPESSAFADVELDVALAHETLWSLSLAQSRDDVMLNPATLALTGASHHEQALSHFHDVLRRVPSGWKLDVLRRHVRRVEIGVDTAQRAFFCPGDD
ncbi:MAG TPA: hypothetical protein VGR66_01250, partial [Candidatus Eisenbacteria bacterium]|nr:hypothetical protein [Candidatus Eisenbacteria bacterium]